MASFFCDVYARLYVAQWLDTSPPTIKPNASVIQPSNRPTKQPTLIIGKRCG